MNPSPIGVNFGGGRVAQTAGLEGGHQRLMEPRSGPAQWPDAVPNVGDRMRVASIVVGHTSASSVRCRASFDAARARVRSAFCSDWLTCFRLVSWLGRAQEGSKGNPTCLYVPAEYSVAPTRYST